MHLISQTDSSGVIQRRKLHTCVWFRYNTVVATVTSAANKNFQILLRGFRSHTNSGFILQNQWLRSRPTAMNVRCHVTYILHHFK